MEGNADASEEKLSVVTSMEQKESAIQLENKLKTKEGQSKHHRTRRKTNRILYKIRSL